MFLTEPITPVLFDTAKGLIEIQAVIKNKRCVATRWETQLPKVLLAQYELTLPDGQLVPVSVIDSGVVGQSCCFSAG